MGRVWRWVRVVSEHAGIYAVMGEGAREMGEVGEGRQAGCGHCGGG